MHFTDILVVPTKSQLVITLILVGVLYYFLWKVQIRFLAFLSYVHGLPRITFPILGGSKVGCTAEILSSYTIGSLLSSSRTSGRGYEREYLKAPNGSTVAIDWFDSPGTMSKLYHGLLVVVNHGCLETVFGNVISLIVQQNAKHHIGCCVVNFQGVSGVPVSNVAGGIGVGLSYVVELKAATERIIQHVGELFPKSMIGFSIGGCPVLEYIAQDAKRYTSACLVSVPLQVEAFCCREGNRDVNHCLSDGKRLIKLNGDVLTDWNPEACATAISSPTLWKMINAISNKPMEQLKSNTYADGLWQVAVPTLLVYTLDDEAIDFKSNVDLLRISQNKHIGVCVLEVGGHCPRKSWLANAILEFASNSMREPELVGLE